MPLIYTGPPDIVDGLLQLYRSSVPGDVASSARNLDEANALAEMAAVGEGQAVGWAREARLSNSHGIWTDQHAKDRGTSRQSDETDDELKGRLRTAPKAITEESIQDALDAIADPAYLVAVPRTHGAFADSDGWCDADSRVTPHNVRCTVALIPASANAKPAALEALRSKVPAGHFYSVEEF